MGKQYLASDTKEIQIGDAKIKIKKLSYGVAKQFMQVDKNNVNSENTDNMLLASIASWNLTDNDDKALPVDKKSLDNLTVEFVNKLSQEILKYNNLGIEEAKN